MKRPWLILLGGFVLAIAGFACAYVFATASQHTLEHASKPELVWLKQEYQLSDEQYTKVCQLYAAYHPKCMEMCREINEQNARLKEMLSATNVVTPEIAQALADTAQLRAKCEANMLDHFYATSRAMPPPQGRRYLAWMQKETLIPSPMTADQSTSRPLDHYQPQQKDR